MHLFQVYSSMSFDKYINLAQTIHHTGKFLYNHSLTSSPGCNYVLQKVLFLCLTIIQCFGDSPMFFYILVVCCRLALLYITLFYDCILVVTINYLLPIAGHWDYFQCEAIMNKLRGTFLYKSLWLYVFTHVGR